MLFRSLDCFSSTGGFALHVAGHAESVEAIESSELAIAAAEENARSNGIANIQFRQADVFDFLSGVSPSSERSESIWFNGQQNPAS